MRIKLPHYNVGDSILDALANRMYYALMCLDEIGTQYYLGANNDTMDTTLYHFNYFITLITGIFDNLAIKTDSHLNINTKPQIRVSLSTKSGKDFLKEIREKNPQIRDHIKQYNFLIQLAYSFREKVIHQEGLDKTHFNNVDVGWEANVLKISQEQYNLIKNCGDSKTRPDAFSKWGIWQTSNEYFMVPYNFVLEYLSLLLVFVNIYLELLGYSSFIKKLKEKPDTNKQIISFVNELETFETYHLGF